LVLAAKGDETMTEEKNKEEKKGCKVCLALYLARPMPIGMVIVFCVLVMFLWFLTVASYQKDVGFGVLLGVFSLLVTGALVWFVGSGRGSEKYLCLFSDKRGELHHHTVLPPARQLPDGKTVYYFVPQNAPSNAPLEDWDITGPILRLRLVGWFKTNQVFNVEVGRAADWIIDRVRVVVSGGDEFIALRLRRRSCCHYEEHVVSAEEAIRLIEFPHEATVIPSTVNQLIGRVKQLKSMLGCANDDVNMYADAAGTWKKQAVDGWSRVNALYEVLQRLERALAASKSVSKSKIVADARVAVAEIMDSNLLHSINDEQMEAVCRAIQDAGTLSVSPIDVLVREFDQSIEGKDVPMLKVSPTPAAVVRQA